MSDINLSNDKPVKGLMSSFNNSNPFDVDTSNFKWVDLKTLYNTDPKKKYKALGFFTNSKGKYGTEPCAIIQGFKVNLPRHLLSAVQQFIDNDNIVDYIKQGHCGFYIEPYHSDKYNKDGYSVHWLDL